MWVCGGVCFNVRGLLRHGLWHISCLERVWISIRSDRGPVLVCFWYRPPEPGDTSFVKAFCSEFREHSRAALGCIVVDDVNCHSIRWLRYSSRNSPEGAALYNACLELGLVQRVRSPTREGSLLDLVLSDVNSMACRVLLPVADHKVVEIAVKFSVLHCVTSRRTVRHFGKADWANLVQSLAMHGFSFLYASCPSQGAKRLTQTILVAVGDFIPTRVPEKRQAGPVEPLGVSVRVRIRGRTIQRITTSCDH